MANVLLIDGKAYTVMPNSPADMTALIQEHGKDLVIVATLAKLANPRHLKALILAQDPLAIPAAIHHGIAPEKVKLIADTLAEIDEVLTTAKTTSTDYPFAAVPDTFNPDTAFQVRFFSDGRTRSIERGSYSIGFKTFERNFELARQLWQYGHDRTAAIYDNVSGYSNKRFEFYKDRVVIGCQTIPRYEVEAMAVAVGLI